MHTTFIALLRGINVGGHRPVAMSDLKAMLTRLGFEDPRSFLQSGNLIFRSDGKSTELENMLEAEAYKRLRLQSDFVIRDAKEWREIVARNPFCKEAEADPGHLVVMFLKTAPKPSEVKAAQDAIVGRETLRADGRQIYVVYPDGIGRSRLTNALLEKKLATRGTGRNWNTVLKLLGVADELDRIGGQK